MALLNKESNIIAEHLLNAGNEKGFQVRECTPLVSPFWETTFTPSSSEVMFREIRNSAGIESSRFISTIQPCCRFADIVHSGDNSHILFFHMVTFFSIGVKDVLADVNWFIDAISNSINKTKSELLFTYFTSPSTYVQDPLFTDFGLPMLEACGIDSDNCIGRKGLANYQLDLHRYETGNTINVRGPRIEIFCKTNTDQVLEIGTLILSTGMMSEEDKLIIPKTLSMVAGPERMQIIHDNKKSIWEINPYSDFLKLFQEKFLSKSEILVAEQDLKNALDICIALLQLSHHAPELKPSGRDIGHHLRRLLRDELRLLEHLGIPLNEFWETTFSFMDKYVGLSKCYDPDIINTWINMQLGVSSG